MRIKVSIPFRYAENNNLAWFLEYDGCGFQFLLGTLKTEIENAEHSVIVAFQFLLGTLKTKDGKP